MRVFLLFLVLASTACSTTKSASNTAATSSSVLNTADISGNLNAVAQDLVTTMASLRLFPPSSTTVQFSEPEFSFAHEVINSLRTTGYGTQKVSDDQGPHYIEIERKQANGDTNPEIQMRYSIRVADVTIARLFKVNGSSLVPVSTISIQGASPQPMPERGDMYGSSISIDEALNAVEFRDDADDFLVLIEPGIDQPSTDSDKTYYPVKQLVIRFNPNSLDIGRENKIAIKSLTDNYTENDRFTVSACHQSNTPLWDGNNDIALKRDKRVMQELLSLGIPINNTYSENCASDNYNRLLEKYSVVLTRENTRVSTSNRPRRGQARYGFF